MITLSADTAICPACEAPLVKLNFAQRKCNTCVFEALLLTEADEREAEEITRRYGRDAVLGSGDERTIGRNATSW